MKRYDLIKSQSLLTMLDVVSKTIVHDFAEQQFGKYRACLMFSAKISLSAWKISLTDTSGNPHVINRNDFTLT